MDPEASLCDLLERMLIDEMAEPEMLPLALLESITNNFSDDLKVGEGGLAVVYKGVLENGSVAVKKLRNMDEKKFVQEVNDLLRVRHKNIVRFMGYCSVTQGEVLNLPGNKFVLAETRQRLLCFEFMPKGSLDSYISDAARGLEWMTRYQIIKGICEGLHHLHQQKILHLDLKPANILLDHYMVPKIADFGISRCFDEKKTQDVTLNSFLTEGYVAPESDRGLITIKSDIYSLGTVITQILTGHKGYHPIENILEAWSARFEKSQGDAQLESVRLCAEIGRDCRDFIPDRRPDTWYIIERLAEMEHKYGFAKTDPFTSTATHAHKVDSMNQRSAQLDQLQEKKINQVVRSHEAHAPYDLKNSRHMEIDLLERILDGRDEPSNLSLPLLEHITENFSSDCLIDCGGCGGVYKGGLPNGKFVAVKKLFKNHTMDEKMFDQEVQSMMMVKHQNIVRFLGYCSDTQGKAVQMNGKIVMADDRERLLCLEYISKGSLAKHLADELRGLDWCARYQIIKGVCEGLDHLHNDKGILHMDLKPANILVDDKMVPKITDFGLARTDGKTHTMSTARLVSAIYCAPEYRVEGKMSNKSDIYSLGFIIIEMVTGSTLTPNINKVLGRWWHRWNESQECKLLWYEQVKKCLELALECVRDIPIHRPSISDIIRELNEIDNRNDKVRGDHEATYEELRPYLEAMLGIEPLKIHFPFALDNKEISCSVELTNDTDNYIAFMVSTTSLLRYKIQPKKDYIPPRSKCCITIALQAQEKARLHDDNKEEFYVHSTRVDETLTTKAITEKMFHEEESKVVNEVNLPVVFDGPF